MYDFFGTTRLSPWQDLGVAATSLIISQPLGVGAGSSALSEFRTGIMAAPETRSPSATKRIHQVARTSHCVGLLVDIFCNIYPKRVEVPFLATDPHGKKL